MSDTVVTKVPTNNSIIQNKVTFYIEMYLFAKACSIQCNTVIGQFLKVWENVISKKNHEIKL